MNLDKLHDYLWPDHVTHYRLHISLYLTRKSLNLFRLACFLLYFIPSTIYTWSIGGLPFIEHFFFFTNWGQVGCMIYFALAFYSELKTDPKNPPKHGKLWKITHILFESCFAMEFTIALFFWAILAAPYFDSIKDEPDFGVLIFKNVLLHAVTPLTMWIEIAVNYIDFHWRHAYVFIPSVFIAYSMLNALGVLALDVPIYQPVIDWKSFKTPLLLSIGLVLGFVGFAVGWWVHKIKERKLGVPNLKIFLEEDLDAADI